MYNLAMRKKPISIRLPVDLLAKIDREAKAMGISRTELIEQRCGDERAAPFTIRSTFGELDRLHWWTLLPLVPASDIVELSIRHISPTDSIARPGTPARIAWEKANPVTLPDGATVPRERDPKPGKGAKR